MNKLRLEITINGETYVEKHESSLSATELAKSIRAHGYFCTLAPNVITMYNFDNVDVLKIIQE